MPNQDDREAITEQNCFQERDRRPVPGYSAMSGLGSPPSDRSEVRACGNFYVYRLIDPRDSACFYIGKGRGERAWTHQKTAAYETTPNHRKRARILEIVATGLEVQVEIVARFADERMAYAHEYDLIQTTANLTNIAPGWAPPPTREEILEARRLAIIAKRLAEIERRKEGRKAQYERFVKGLPPHLKEVAKEWLDGLQDEAPQEIEKPYILTTLVPDPNAEPRPKKKRVGSIRANRRKYRKKWNIEKVVDRVALPPLPILPPKL